MRYTLSSKSTSCNLLLPVESYLLKPVMNSSVNETSAPVIPSPLGIAPLAMGQAFDTGALGAIL